MEGCHLEKWLICGSVFYAIFSSNLSAAQVVGDTTLPAGERSQVTGNPNFQIDGGARRGGNLFHSFQSFSIPTGGSAYFNNAIDVQNIFSRVTGGSISNIDGLIRANGTANLFLLNPNGILFGSNASLNIGGSFVASTASSINFADNFHYSATNPQTLPLLTINIPIGLQFGQNPGRIVVQGGGHNIIGSLFSPVIGAGRSLTGLRVLPGQTLALVGGDVALEGGLLTAPGGRIELGSVASGVVSLSPTAFGWTLGYGGEQSFQDIRLSQKALIDASGVGVGDIQLVGRRIVLTDGSTVLIENQSTQPGGSISVNASESLELSGVSPAPVFISSLINDTVGVGNGGNIVVSTKRLVIQGGAQILTDTYSTATAGNIQVNASDSVQVSGFVPSNPAILSVIAASSYSSGRAGNVIVSTGQLTATDGGVVTSVTFATGKGGDVTVNANSFIELIGVIPNFFTPSSVSASAFNAGDAGNLTINTPRLVLRDGGIVGASSFANGKAGSVTINAPESVEVSGTVPESRNPSQIISSTNIVDTTLQQLYNLPPVPSGTSGDVTINTGRLSVTDGALVTVKNDGLGNAGTLRVKADVILLDNQAAITAATASGEGGNIDLKVRDFLLLRNNSSITASAGGTGNGGNITINTSSLVALPSENSDIRADSVNARGGNVTINTSGLFGIEFRDRNTPLSDITATGASSELSGTVEVNVQDVDPTRGLARLPTDVVNASGAIDQACRDVRGSSFVVTGRGGLPPTPQQALGDDPRWRDWRTPAVVSRQLNATGNGILPPSVNSASTKSAVVEATGWVIEPDGKVILTATAPHVTSPNRWEQPVNCDGS
ncbi:MAG TPA: S-layer family protein [Waterburya sp.]|jgi:filamentous hemagglutinin family protein